MSVKTLTDMGFERASHLESGFKGWKEAGLPVVSYEEWSAARRA